MQGILKLARVQVFIIPLFFISKAWLRPYVLDRDFHPTLDIIVLSLPNFYEGIIGVLTISGIWFYINHKWISPGKHVDPKWIYFFSTVLAAIYVITQELKIHNLGGNNVYDPYDILFSIVGLVIGYIIVLKIQPQIRH